MATWTPVPVQHMANDCVNHARSNQHRQKHSTTQRNLRREEKKSDHQNEKRRNERHPAPLNSQEYNYYYNYNYYNHYNYNYFLTLVT